MTATRTLRLTAVLAVVAAVGLAGCAAPSVPADSPAFAPPPATTPPALAADTCDNARQSYDPYPSLTAPAALKGDTLQARIKARGRLVVGVSGDSKLLGSRSATDPNEFEGFDIDLARAVGRAIFGPGNDTKVQFRVITAAQRIPLVNDGADKGGVDLVARNMTMNCARWEQVNFSATYLVAEQRVLVPKASDLKNAPVLAKAKARVCAPAGSTSIQRVAHSDQFKGIVPVEVDQHTTCLALLQQNRVDAITGDSTVLAGLAAQDDKVEVLPPSYGEEPYGLAVGKDHEEFARFLNTVLADYVASGGWQKSYDKYFLADLGKASAPTPQYGR